MVIYLSKAVTTTTPIPTLKTLVCAETNILFYVHEIPRVVKFTGTEVEWCLPWAEGSREW